MTTFQKVSLFGLRVVVGWMFFYSGIIKVLDPLWSSEGYLKSAKTFTGFYLWLSEPSMLGFTNFLNEWGLTLIGIAVFFGVIVRISSILGALMMLLYYLSTLDFPYPNVHSFIVDEHIVYIFAFLVLGGFQVGRMWGGDVWLSKFSFFRRLGC